MEASEAFAQLVDRLLIDKMAIISIIHRTFGVNKSIGSQELDSTFERFIEELLIVESFEPLVECLMAPMSAFVSSGDECVI